MTAATLTLTSFLLARIADDEAVAHAASDSVPLVHRDDAGGEAYLRRFGSARVLAECEAKRRIVARCLDVIASFGDWDAAEAEASGGRKMWIDVNRRERSHAHATLDALASVYADHPDFDPEWRP